MHATLISNCLYTQICFAAWAVSTHQKVIDLQFVIRKILTVNHECSVSYNLKLKSVNMDINSGSVKKRTKGGGRERGVL